MSDRFLLVLDMDNTLYDWRAHFCSVFVPAVAALSDLICESTVALKRQFRTIHKDEGHREWASAIRRLPSVTTWARGNPKRTAQVDDLVLHFVEVGRSSLQAYCGVEETLTRIAGAGWVVVVFTESPALDATERLRGMNILNKVDAVYGTSRSNDATPLDAAVVHLPRFTKPAPEVLRSIVRRHQATPGTAIYVGDSLTRDVPMAQKSGVTGVWARYGAVVEPRHRHIISEVSCWAAEKVDRELGPQSAGEYRAPFAIESFPEIIQVLAAKYPSCRIEPG
jgi:FMN phosphatase YigB (HAD superfamily)